MSKGPEEITLHVAEDGLVMLDRGYDTTPVRYVRKDLLRPRTKPVEADESERTDWVPNQSW